MVFQDSIFCTLADAIGFFRLNARPLWRESGCKCGAYTAQRRLIVSFTVSDLDITYHKNVMCVPQNDGCFWRLYFAHRDFLAWL